MNNVLIGSLGENLAKEFLLNKNYEILDTNVRFSHYCELDIVAKKKNTLVFVEVKTRKNANFGLPSEAVTPTKYNNIKKGIYFYLSEKNIKYDRYQIDVISIVLKPVLKIEHLENI